MVFTLMRRWSVIERSQIGITFLYIVVTFVSQSLFFIAVSLLPVATVTFILFGLFAFSLCSNERITLKNVLLAGLCVSGVTLVIQPWILHSEDTGTANFTNQVSSAFGHVTNINGNNVTNSSAAGIYHMTELQVGHG